MNLTIKDLSASTELDQAAMTAVHGGDFGQAVVPTLIQGLEQNNINMVGAGAGSAINNTNDVTGTLSATQHVNQNIGDVLKVKFGFPRMY
jgi:hypothetical protein